MKRSNHIIQLLLRILIIAIAVGSPGFCNASGLLQSALTTQTITVRVDRDTSITRRCLTAPGLTYLDAIQTNLPEPNRSIVKLLRSYPMDGSHDYWWPKRGEGSYDGATTNIVLNGNTVMKGEPKKRTFCCGLTLEVFYRYLSENSAAVQNFDSDRFKGLWFCQNINSPGPLDALTAFKMGEEVKDWKSALPGDFVQIWRTNRSGHSVIFVNWIYDLKGNIIGLQYWSTQQSTTGIGFRSELFGNLPGTGLMDEQHFSIARPSLMH